jgi:VCBS repeat-containing protein
MAVAVTLPGSNIFTFTELNNVTGSNFLHVGATKTASLTDDNTAVLPGNYDASFAYTPNPPRLPGSIDVFVSSISGPGGTTGTVDFDFEVIDRQIDFLRQGQTLTQTINVTITDLNGGDFDVQPILVQITGRNDKPKAFLDLMTISENVTTVKNKVVANDKDPDLGDTKALTVAGFDVLSVTSTGSPFLTEAMLKATRVNFSNNALPLKDSIMVEFGRAFQGLAAGEKATVKIKYGMVDGFGATSASELRLTITGSNDAQIVGTNGNDPFLFGEKDADQIFGLNGNDVINSRGGNDIVHTGSGKDIVVFSTPLAANRDTISDFNPALDLFHLDNAVFTKLGAAGKLKADFFKLTTGALDGNDYIQYNPGTGALIYDANGSGAGQAVQFATLSNRPALTAADFVVI